MSLEFHHCYVFTEPGAPVVDQLVSLGFTEGSSNSHPGQGTANRRIFFPNGMLEFIWINNESEATSSATAPTRLFERSKSQTTGHSPFGICVCTDNATGIPFQGWNYQPKYLPTHVGIWMANNDLFPWEPAIFQLSGVNPWRESSPPQEPISHPNGAGKILSIEVGLKRHDSLTSDAIEKLREVELIRFTVSDNPFMKIVCHSNHPSMPAPLDLSPWCPLLIEWLTPLDALP